MITYGLGTYTNYAGVEQDDPSAPKAGINIPIGFSKEEYNKVLEAVSKIGNIYKYDAIFRATNWNYEDLVNTVNSYIQAFVQKNANFLGSRDITLNINKEILNVLTSFRFYCNFIDKNLHGDFGQGPEIYAKFKRCCSSEYDKNFSYRLVYQLRNYAQHKGLVVNSINFNKHLDNEDNRTVRHKLGIYTYRQDLLADKDFKKEVRAELINYPEQIDLMEHLSKWMNSLIIIHGQLINNLIPAGLSDALLIIEQTDKLNFDRNDERIVPILSAIDYSEDNIENIISPSLVPLPIENAQSIVAYCKEHNLRSD